MTTKFEHKLKNIINEGIVNDDVIEAIREIVRQNSFIRWDKEQLIPHKKFRIGFTVLIGGGTFGGSITWNIVEGDGWVNIVIRPEGEFQISKSMLFDAMFYNADELNKEWKKSIKGATTAVSNLVKKLEKELYEMKIHERTLNKIK